MMSGDDVLTEPVARRIEVFTGAGRRRKWSTEAKARIVAESYSLSVGEVADRYGLAKTQLFTWRRAARMKASGSAEPGPLQFAPVIVAPVPPRPKRLQCRSRPGGDGGIEIEIGGVAVRVGSDANPRAITAVIRALKVGG
jgi:transposase